MRSKQKKKKRYLYDNDIVCMIKNVNIFFVQLNQLPRSLEM